MFIKQREAEAEFVLLIFWRLCAITIVAIAFSIQLPIGEKILFAFFVSFMVISVQLISQNISYEMKLQSVREWLNHLTIQFAIEDILANWENLSGYNLDWRKHKESALDDHTAAKEADELFIDMPHRIFRGLIVFVFHLIDFLLTPLLGYGLSLIFSA